MYSPRLTSPATSARNKHIRCHCARLNVYVARLRTRRQAAKSPCLRQSATLTKPIPSAGRMPCQKHGEHSSGAPEYQSDILTTPFLTTNAPLSGFEPVLYLSATVADRGQPYAYLVERAAPLAERFGHHLEHLIPLTRDEMERGHRGD